MEKNLEEDNYYIERKTPTNSEIRLHLIEVKNRCTLCGKILQLNK